jgi:putative oxidoreductase
MALAGGLEVAAGYQASRWGARFLVGFLVPVTMRMHAYWKLQDPAMIHWQQAMSRKNLFMLGAALLISQFGAGEVSVDGRK